MATVRAEAAAEAPAAEAAPAASRGERAILVAWPPRPVDAARGRDRGADPADRGRRRRLAAARVRHRRAGANLVRAEPVGNATPVSATLERTGDTGTLHVQALPAIRNDEVYEIWVQRAGVMEPRNTFVLSRDGTRRGGDPGAARGRRGRLRHRASPAAAASSRPPGRCSRHRSDPARRRSEPAARYRPPPDGDLLPTSRPGDRTSPARTAGARSAPTA